MSGESEEMCFILPTREIDLEKLKIGDKLKNPRLAETVVQDETVYKVWKTRVWSVEKLSDSTRNLEGCFKTYYDIINKNLLVNAVTTIISEKQYNNYINKISYESKNEN